MTSSQKDGKHHCVGTYVERVAAKMSDRVCPPRGRNAKAVCDVEVSNGKIEQIHGDHNSDHEN